MLVKRLILGTLVAASLGSFTLPAAARTNVDFHVSVAPPPVQYEVVPAPRMGFVWVPGIWEWRSHRHVWVGGHWVRSRPGHVYHRPRWYDHNGRWYFAHGGWRRSY